MEPPAAEPQTEESRYDRQARIEWWDQACLRGARVLVAGAGALGNELVKNLALLGVGTLYIADFDHVEKSNLSRTVLFRDSDIGRSKAAVAAARASELNPDVDPIPLHADLNYGIGLGLFRHADVVAGCLDNRLARRSLSDGCFRVGTPYVDAGMIRLHGQVQLFLPPKPPCYSCSLGAEEAAELDVRRSCLGTAAHLAREGKAPTMQTISAVIAAIQAQEIVKLLHGAGGPAGLRLSYDGEDNSFSRTYGGGEGCDGCQPLPGPVVERPEATAAGTTVRELLAWGEEALGAGCVYDCDWDVITSLQCSECGLEAEVLKPRAYVFEDDLPCPKCGFQRNVRLLASSIGPDSPWSDCALARLTVPPFHIVTARNTKTRERIHFELAGDADRILSAGVT
jgi:molybdopterin-synthase adenylyltransferase